MDLSQSDWKYVDERAGAFVGREWVFAQVRSFLSGSPGAFLLRGDPGTGKTAVAARLAQASCGRLDTADSPPPVGERAISAGVFCRAGKATVAELAQRLSDQLAASVDGFADALRATAEPGITIRDVRVDVHGDVHAGGIVSGVVLPRQDGKLAFSAGVAVPLRQLRERGAVEPIVLLVDAVDEAADVGEVNVFSRLLANLDEVHLILTCRPDPPVLSDFRAAARKLDLIADVPADDDDVRRYIRNRLRGQGPEEVVDVLAGRVSGEADGNFLCAFYVTGTLTGSGSLAGMDEEAARILPLPTGGLPGVYEDFLYRQIAGDEKRWAEELRPVLAPLCVALGDGFTTEQLAAIASRLTGREFSPRMAGDVTRQVGQYLSGPHPDGPFRVYHQSFARFLADPRQNPNWPIDLSEANNAVVRALTETVPEGTSVARDWAAASTYVRRHLAAHAAAAGILDDLLLDPGYLLAADPTWLLNALPTEAAADASPAERAFRRAVRHLQTKPNPDRASYLSMAARQVGAQELADQIDELNPGAQWSVCWAKWDAAQIHYLDSRYDFDEKYGSLFNSVSAVATGKLNGRAAVAVGCGDGRVRILDMVDGTCHSEFEPETKRPVTAMTIAELDGVPVVVSGYEDGMLRVTDMAEGALLREWHFYGDDGLWATIVSVVALNLNEETLVAACTNNETTRFWNLAEGTLIDTVSDTELDMLASVCASIRSQSGLPDVVKASQPHYPDTDATAVTAASLDGRPVVVSGHCDGTIYVSDLASRESAWPSEACIQQHGLGAYIDSIAVYELGGRPVIVAGGSPGMIGAWDLADGSIVVEPFLSHKHDAVRGVAIAELEGRVVMVAGGQDGLARVWDTENRTLLDEIEVERGIPFVPLAVARPEGQLVIVCGAGEGRVAVWHPSFRSARIDGRACGQVMPALVIQPRPMTMPRRWRLRPWRVRADFQGDLILCSRHYDGTQRYWWLDTGDAVSEKFLEISSTTILTATGELERHPVASSGIKVEDQHFWRLAEIPALEPRFRNQHQSPSPSPSPSQGGEDGGLSPRPLVGVGELAGMPTIVSISISSQMGENLSVNSTIQATLRSASPVPPTIPLEPVPVNPRQPAGIGLLDGQLMAVSGVEGGGLRLWKWSPGNEGDPEVITFMTREPIATAVTLGLVDGQPVAVWAARDGILRVTSLRDPDRAPHLSIELEPHIADVNLIAPGQLAVAGKWGIMLLQLRWPAPRSAQA